jgi:hypothetical protein
MVAPKTEGTKYDLSFSGKEEEDLSGLEDEDKPLRQEDFQRHFDLKARKD